MDNTDQRADDAPPASTLVDDSRDTARAKSLKRFKACRTCKRQKMKCEGPEHAPCKRCQTARTECLFDLVEAPRRQQKRPIDDDLSVSEKFGSLQQEIRELREAVKSLSRLTRHPVSETRVPSEGERRTRQRRESSSGHPGDRTSRHTTSRSNSETVTAARDTIEPVVATAVAASQGSKIHESQHRAPSACGTWRDEDTTSRGGSPTSLGMRRPSEDLISKGFVPEPLARELFERFQARCNVYLPLFDPLTDTFESIRSRSCFCFAAILAIAARLPCSGQPHQSQVMELCQKEARTLAVETLFDSPPRIETVQGMILLAAYSQRCWHAVGHAVRLAQSMHLDRSLSRLIDLHKTPSEQSIGLQTCGQGMADRIILMREVRIWMTLAHLEQEIASGTGKRSLIERDERPNIRQLIQDPFYPRSDSHILAAVELLRHRDRFRDELMLEPCRSGGILLDKMQAKVNVLNECLAFWDGALGEMNCPKDGFHRIHLAIQRNSAEIDVCCAVLDSISSATNLDGQSMFEDVMLSRLLTCAETQLSLILETKSYNWMLLGNPVYSCVSIASTTGLALKVMKLRPHLRDPSSMISLACRIQELLRDYPFATYHRLLDSLKRSLFVRVLVAMAPEDVHIYPQEQTGEGAEVFDWNHGALRSDWAPPRQLEPPLLSSSTANVNQDQDLDPELETSRSRARSESQRPQQEESPTVTVAAAEAVSGWLSPGDMQLDGAHSIFGTNGLLSLWDSPDFGDAYNDNNCFVTTQYEEHYVTEGTD